MTRHRLADVDDDLAMLNGHADAAVPEIADDPFSPIVHSLADVQAEPLDWLWPGRIALGKLTLLAGDPGNGKSLLTIDAAARVSCGRPWPDDLSIENPVGGVVLLSAEDDLGDTIKPRLLAAEADCGNIVAVTGVNWFDSETGKSMPRAFGLEHDLGALEQAIDRYDRCRLIIIDVIDAYLGRTDSHKSAEVRGLLAPLAELAARKHVAIVGITHLSKSGAGNAIYRSMGSIAFVAASRAAWLVAKDKQLPARRLFLPMKNNLAADTAGLAFGIVSDGAAPYLAWERGTVTMTADEALAPEPREYDAPAQDDAAEWLKAMLADGPLSSADLKKQARKDGIAWRTVERAKGALAIAARRVGYGGDGKWQWELPAIDRQEDESPP